MVDEAGVIYTGCGCGYDYELQSLSSKLNMVGVAKEDKLTGTVGGRDSSAVSVFFEGYTEIMLVN